MTKHCTIPNILGLGEWFERNYGSCCRVHDNEYDARVDRYVADKNFLNCLLYMAQDRALGRKLYHYPFIWVGYFVIRLVGWFWYYKVASKIKSWWAKL